MLFCDECWTVSGNHLSNTYNTVYLRNHIATLVLVSLPSTRTIKKDCIFHLFIILAWHLDYFGVVLVTSTLRKTASEQ